MCEINQYDMQNSVKLPYFCAWDSQSLGVIGMGAVAYRRVLTCQHNADARYRSCGDEPEQHLRRVERIAAACLEAESAEVEGRGFDTPALVAAVEEAGFPAVIE